MALDFIGRDVSELGVAHDVGVDPNTGRASLRIPVVAPAGRNGFLPSLTLVYSGGNNSPFGMGWGLAGLPAIGIDTRYHLPRWDGTDSLQFGGDEIVPWLDSSGATTRVRAFTRGRWAVSFYRRRRGNADTRIERWTDTTTGRRHFRSRSANGFVTIYGARSDAAARIAAPSDESRTLLWLPEVVVDPYGNAMWFEYLPETLDGVNRSDAFEARSPSLAQRYLKRIRYGNTQPITLDDATVSGVLPPEVAFCFQLVVDYGDHSDPAYPSAYPDRPWLARADAFSNYRNGFEVRTYRLARRLLSFHEFADLGAGPTLVSSMTLEHDEDAAGARLTSVTIAGHRRDGSSLSTRAVPPLSMTYSAPAATNALDDAPTLTCENVPAGLAGRQTTFIDLLGDGLPGILSEIDRAWYYKPNLGGGDFGAQTLVIERPLSKVRADGLGDFDRDGNPDLTETAGRFAGSFAFDRDERTWGGFRPLPAIAQVAALHNRAQWVDLNGDGLPDIVVSGSGKLVWFASAGDEFEEPVELTLPNDWESAPAIAANPALDFFLVDMSGDGLADLVRVRNGCVEYWPSLGNGRFGQRVVMEGAPQFDDDVAFDASRLRFVDLDGSGSSDIVYLGRGEVRRFVNASGNRLVALPVLGGMPTFDNVASVRIVDFLGDGRACLVWSSPLPGSEGRIEYLPLTPQDPPGTLLTVDDSRGRTTRLTYSSSAQHYLRDVLSGRGWSTHLPSHHHVVDRVEVSDAIRRASSVQRFEYHDGYYDGGERENRGFAQVDVYDADATGGTSPGSGGLASAPPSVVRTWFHMGTAMWGRQLVSDTFVGDSGLPMFPPHEVDGAAAMTPAEIEDGLRTLAGQVVRRERYAVDDLGARAAVPFDVMQTTHRLRRVQPAFAGELAGFTVSSATEATWTYEQVAADPRVEHRVVIATDDHDFPTREVSIAYPRRASSTLDTDAQTRFLLEVEDHRVVHLDDDEHFQLGIPIEEKRIELVGVRPSRGMFARADLTAAAIATALASPSPHDADVVDDPTTGPRARWSSWDRSFYYDDSGALAALGTVGSAVLLHHEESACLAAATLADAFGGRVDDARLRAAGYVVADGYYWRPTVTHVYTPASQFSMVASLARADGATTTFAYDPLWVALVGITDPVGNSEQATVDYHRLAPKRIVDANGNVRECAYDPLGVLVRATASGHVGTSAWGFDPLGAPPAPMSTAGALADPSAALAGAARAVYYDLDAWTVSRAPTTLVVLDREELKLDGAGGGTASGRVRVVVAYFDGLGRSLQARQLVEDGPAITRDGAGHVMVDASGRPTYSPASPRWAVTGNTTYDTKGRPSLTYEPYFSPTSAYESDDVLEQFGFAVMTRYDAIGRAVGQSFPNGTYSTIAYGSWSADSFDPNDTVMSSAYRAVREALPSDAPERQALEEAKPHDGTFTRTFLDPLGRACGELAKGGSTANDRRTLSNLRIEGRPSSVVDPRGLVAFTYRYDMLGGVVHQQSVDAGDAWSLVDAYGRLATTWDSRGFVTTRAYDALDRPVYTHVTGGDGPTPLDHRVEQWEYGDGLGDRVLAAQRNALGRLVVVRDGGGVKSLEQYDPTGRVVSFTTQYRQAFAAEPNWLTTEALQSDVLTMSATFDAGGRVVRDTLADGSTRIYQYTRSGSLTRATVTTPDGSVTNYPVLDGVTVGARGERLTAHFGNGVDLTLDYDPQTLRTSRKTAVRGAATLQALRYTYDPVGNVVRATDAAQDGATPVVGGATASARRDYVYDAHYRLRSASGRVHGALLQFDYVPGAAGSVRGTRRVTLADGSAIERFTRTYDYDDSGNLQRIRHAGASHSWTTEMWISTTSNRSLPALNPDGTPLTTPDARFDAAGNTTSLSHLRRVAYDSRGSLSCAVTIARPGSTDDGEYSCYDSDRLRARKVTTRLVGGVVETTEKVYCGDLERKRITVGTTLVLERWSIHMNDDDERLAIVHRWTKDDLARETTDISRARVRHQLSTQPGSSAFELDESGNVISYEEYFPYGGTAFVAAASDVEVNTKDYRFVGYESDDLSGLYYAGYRFYASWMGRWLTPDPIGPEDDVNLYQFVLGNPVSNRDERGLQTTEPEGGVEFHNIAPADRSSPERYAATISSPALRAGFLSLSAADQQRVLRGEPYVRWIDARGQFANWRVVSQDELRNVWMPRAQSYARAHHVRISFTIETHNPDSAASGNGTGTDGTDEPADIEVTVTAPRRGSNGTSGTASDPASGTGTTGTGTTGAGGGSGGAGDGQTGSGPPNEGTGSGGTTAPGSGNGSHTPTPMTGTGDGTGSGSGTSGTGTGSGNAGTGPGSGGNGPRAHRPQGAATTGNGPGEFGGREGGRPGGVLGGTPYARGSTLGSTGDSETGAPGTGSGGAGRDGGSGASPTGSVTGHPGAPPSNGSGPGSSGRPPEGPPQRDGTSPSAGRDQTQGQGPGGGQGGQGPQPPPGSPYSPPDGLMRFCGYLNLVFDQDQPGGDPGGVPGAFGLFNWRGPVLQWLYVVTTIVSTIFMVRAIVMSIARGALSRLGAALLRLLRSPLAALRGLFAARSAFFAGTRAFFRTLFTRPWRLFWARYTPTAAEAARIAAGRTTLQRVAWAAERARRAVPLLGAGRNTLYTWEHIFPQVLGSRFPRLVPFINSYLNSFLVIPRGFNASLGTNIARKLAFYFGAAEALRRSWGIGSWLGGHIEQQLNPPQEPTPRGAH